MFLTNLQISFRLRTNTFRHLCFSLSSRSIPPLNLVQRTVPGFTGGVGSAPVLIHPGRRPQAKCSAGRSPCSHEASFSSGGPM